MVKRRVGRRCDPEGKHYILSQEASAPALNLPLSSVATGNTFNIYELQCSHIRGQEVWSKSDLAMGHTSAIIHSLLPCPRQTSLINQYILSFGTQIIDPALQADTIKQSELAQENKISLLSLGYDLKYPLLLEHALLL